MNRQQRRKSEAMRPRKEAGSIPSEDLELFWSLVVPAREDEQLRGGGPYYSALHAVMGASRFVLTKKLMNLAEDLRISDLVVTINSFDKGLPFPGRTWLEWDARVEGRLPPDEHQAPIDRIGILIDADDTGQRGVINLLSRFEEGHGGATGGATISPVAITFDLRDDYERPPSLIEPITVAGVRRALAAVQDPTPAEMDGSPVVSAALSRRFGVIENPYLAPILSRLGSGGQPWHQARPEMLRAAVTEAMDDVALTLCAFIVLRTVDIKVTQVLRGARRKAPVFGFDTTPLGYSIFSVAA